jgi:hypothetical protein
MERKLLIIVLFLLSLIAVLLWLNYQPKGKIQSIKDILLHRKYKDASLISQKEEKCPLLPAGYTVREKVSLPEYSKKEKAPWGGFVHMVMGHWEDGKVTPEISLPPGRYAFFAEKPQLDGRIKRNLSFLGYTTKPKEWIECYSPQSKGSLVLTVFDIPPKDSDLKGTNLEGHGGIKGWAIVSLEPVSR